MPSVNYKQGEPVENMLRRFKRMCEKAGILTELKRRARYIKPAKIRAQQKAAAVKRYMKKLAKEAPHPSRGIRGKRRKAKGRRR
ncbi:MAG: 30S ribosomal protein S21 [Legionellales bacterium]|nr:30S ribosomal protein S21 [Legionellales bacterium]